MAVARATSLGESRPFRRLSPKLVGVVARRIASFAYLAIGITFVSFALTQLVPADPALATLGQDATPAAIHAFHVRYGLDRPLPVRYGLYLERLVQGDLGTSQQTQNPVTHDLSVAIPATAELALLSVLGALLLGMSFGIIAALFRDRPLDYVLRVLSLGGVSVPTFWIGLSALYLLYFKYGMFPGGGRLDPTTFPPPHLTGAYTIDSIAARQWSTLWNAMHHLILPAAVLALFNIGVLTRYTRSAILEIIDQDYVRAARARGLPERTVIIEYVLRAAIPSIVTVFGLMFANVLAGAVLVENIFAWPGLGQYGYRAATTLDLPAITGVSLFVATVYITINLTVDLLNSFIDPRIRVSD